MRCRMAFLAVLAIAVLLACESDRRGELGGAPHLVDLQGPLLRFPHPFSSVASLHALPQCRVVVADPLEGTVGLLSIRDTVVEILGRPGPGPGEFANLDGLVPFRDSVFVLDARGLRLQPYSVIDGGAGDPISLPQALFGSQIRAMDEDGNLYMTANILQGRSVEVGGRERVSLPLLRHNLRTAETDTVAALYVAPNVSVQMVRREAGNVRRDNIIIPQPHGHTDAWVLSADGRLRIVRSDPYRLEVIHAGMRDTFPSLEYDPVRVVTADKVRGAVEVEFAWPDEKQPFVASSIVSAPNGNVWLRREVAADADHALYDVLDSRGHVAMQVSLPRGATVRDVDSSRVYVVTRDEVDLMWLEIYPRPLSDGTMAAIDACLPLGP